MLSPPQTASLIHLVTDDDQQFFKELGARIAQLRKDAGLSQQAVAGALELASRRWS